MDCDRRSGPHYVNGMSMQPRPNNDKRKDHNYKLIIDPFLHKGHAQKVYRFDGVVPGENRVVSTRDPRNRATRLWTRQQQADLSLPKFKYDEYYVGIPPPKDVTFTNLNDNINKDFLENMCKGCGKIEECKIYYHPRTKKHLGIGKTLFTSSKAAKACVDKLNQTSKMGNIINVFIDTMGKERNRLIEELTTENVKRHNSPERRSSHLSDSFNTDTEAYDPSDSFEMGHPPETEYTPSVETDLSAYSEGGYSVPQSEMSFSSQDTGYSSRSSAMGAGNYHRDNYNQYPMESAHTGGGDYYPHSQAHQYSGNHRHHRHPPPSHHHHQSRHRSSHVIHHQPPATPAHRHTPQATPHYSLGSKDMDNQYGFYAPPPPIPKPMFDRPPPPLPPEPPFEPPRQEPPRYEPPCPAPPRHEPHVDFQNSHRDRSKHNNKKKKSKKEPPKPPSPELASEEPRFQSLESRIQSLLHGMGSPDHASSSSQDESTPSHITTKESSFEFYPPPATEPLPPLPDLQLEDSSEVPSKVSATPVAGNEEDTREQFESEELDSQTVIEETIDTNSSAGVEPPLPNGCVNEDNKCSDKGLDDEDDRMSLSSISSGEEKLEINPPLPPSTPVKGSAATTQQSPIQLPSTPNNVTSSWHSHIFNTSFLGSPPPGYQQGIYGLSGTAPQIEERDDPNDKTFSTVLDKFVKELKQVLQKDLCKKMVENSAFKSFERWWDSEVTKSKKSTTVEKEPEPLPSTSTTLKPKAEIKPELSASLASLFESRDRGAMESSGMGYGGFLGIRGGMPKLPSFKRKFPRASPALEEDEDSRKAETKSAEDEESDDEVCVSKAKPVISESEESDDSSDDEKEEDDMSADDDDGSDESSEEEESEESEEESEDSEESAEEDQPETIPKDDKPAEKRDEEKMVVDEDEEVDIETEDNIPPAPKEESEDDSKESDMETDAEKSSAKESPEKRPLSPILEEQEKESQTKGEHSDSVKVSTTSNTESTTSSADSSAMDSDSSAFESASKKSSPKSKSGKGCSSVSSLSDKDPSAVTSTETAASDHVEVAESLVSSHNDLCVEEEVHDSESSNKLTESEAEQRSHFMVPAIAEHDYFTFPPSSAKEESTMDSDQTESADEDSETLSEVLVDHNYSLPPIVEQVKIGKAILKKEAVISPKPAKKEPKKRARTKKSKNNMLADITNRSEEKVSRELANLLTPAKPVLKFKPRTFQDERQIFFSIYDKGISEEDVQFLKRSYDELIQSDDPNFYWLNDILWVDHTHTDIPDVLPLPPKKRKKTEDHIPKPHKTGCARSEGYYKLSMMEKAGYLRHAHNLQLQQKAAEDLKKVQEGKKAQTSREARHHNRRLQTTYSDLETDLLRFNQLKFRKKQLKFAKSGIHDWGLFALEPIASEEMVIEYVGQVVRQSIADEREKRYEAIGIGSSYLFRVDTETIIDATRTGNLARFINHSCNPNCYAKIITVESEKKIVIYSKRDIDVNEEITYDYKFPIEDEKIPCLCGSQGCRGTLN